MGRVASSWCSDKSQVARNDGDMGAGCVWERTLNQGIKGENSSFVVTQGGLRNSSQEPKNPQILAGK